MRRGGEAHTLLVLTEGTALAAGSGSCGQLGLDNFDDSRNFQPITAVVSGERVVLACAGEEFSFLLTAGHDIFAMGLNNAGQLGVEGMPLARFPTESRECAEKSTVDMLGRSGGFAVSDAGEVWAWGTHFDGLGGIRPVPQLGQKRVHRIKPGRNHFAALLIGASPTYSFATAAEDSLHVQIGTAFAFSVHARDDFDQPLVSGGDIFHARTVNLGSGDICFQETELLDSGNGTYAGVVNPTVAGSFDVEVRLHGEQIKGSPITITVSAPAVVEQPGAESTPDITEEEKAKRLAIYSKLKKQEMTRRRAQKALRRKQREMRRAKEEAYRKSQRKRTGGGWIISFEEGDCPAAGRAAAGESKRGWEDSNP